MLLKVTQCITCNSQWLFLNTRLYLPAMLHNCHVVLLETVLQKYWDKPRGEWIPISYLFLFSFLKVLTCLRARLYGLECPRQPFPRVTLAELTFHLFLCKIQPNVCLRIANPSWGLGGGDNMVGRVVSSWQVG